MWKAEGRRQNPLLTTLVCFALREEAAPFQRLASAHPEIHILATGIGQANADKSLRHFLACNSPKLVLTCGFAGGLSPELGSGTVVFSVTGSAELERKLAVAGALPGRFHCASRIVTTTREKQALRRTTGADAVEMESGAIQAICREQKIPCATVRVILDAAHEDLPLDFNTITKSDLSLDYGKLVLAVAKSPGRISALVRLQKQCRFAAERLAEVLAGVVWTS